MIKINLAPIDELESQYWYLPEAIMLILSISISYFGVQSYLDGIRDEILVTTTQVEEKDKSLKDLTKETARYDQLDKDIARLNQKLDALKKITVSKIDRFKPVILLEHLQNLKPEGIWYNYLSDSSSSNRITIVGKSFDNILVAELMTAAIATKSQEMDESDLRTQVYFDEVRLERVASNGSNSSTGRGQQGNGPTGGVVPEVPEENAGEYWTGTDSLFPEMSKFPSFQLTLVYKERTPSQRPAQIVTDEGE